jgi:hypothetical protein
MAATSTSPQKDTRVLDSSVDSLHEEKDSVEDSPQAPRSSSQPHQSDDVEKQAHNPNTQSPQNGDTAAAAPTAPPTGHVNDLSSVPNGGFQAWLQVAGAFALFFNSW